MITYVFFLRLPSNYEDDIYILEDICEINIQLFNIDYDENGETVGELTRGSALRFSRIVNLIRYDNHICWTENFNNLLKKFRCHICDFFLSSTRNLLNHQRQCRENIKHVYPTGVYQLKETVFERLEDIGIHVEKEIRLFTNFAFFDFESITVADNTLKNSDSTTWIGRHVPISVSISYSFGSGVILCNSDPKQLVRHFIEKLLEASQLSSVLVIENFERVFNDLNEKITECEQFSDEVDKANSRVEEEAQPQLILTF